MSKNLKFFNKKKTSFKENGIKAILSMGYEQEHDGIEKTCESQSNLSKLSLNASLSLSNCGSQKNLKPSHQMLIAEAVYNPSLPLITKSRLSKSLVEVLNDNNCFSYFVQLLEFQKSNCVSWIRLWVQINCFKKSFQTINNCDNYFLKTKDIREDALKIFETYLNISSQDNFVFDFDLNPIKQKLLQNKIDEHVFDQIQKWIEQTLEKNFLDQFLKSSYFCRYQLDILTNGTLSLADILYHDSVLFYFMEFMEQEGMKHYVDFLLMAENCRRCECQSEDYLIIFNKFFLIESSYFLEMSDSIKCQLEKDIKANLKHCFDKPMSILIQYFERTYFKQFIQSPTFFSYLTECINSLHSHSTPSIPSKSMSVLNQNLKPNKTQKSMNHKNYLNSSFSLQLNDFDDIWKREYAGDLQIAYVNKYGKLMSNFEPEPEKVNNVGISLSKLGLKFGLNGSSEEKEKEELAWEVAQMIIDDVQNLTQRIDS